jgi:hypothetical protein
VVREYFRESGNVDSGLYILASLKSWQKEGWWLSGPATGKRIYFRCCKPKPKPPTPPPTPTTEFHDIYAYGAVNPKDDTDVSNCISLLNGVYVGIALPNSAKNQDVWHVVGDDATPGSWGRHCVYINIYNKLGLRCVTWGEYKDMTWAFLATYCDEAFGIVDNRNAYTPNSPVDIEKLDAYLHQIMEG